MIDINNLYFSYSSTNHVLDDISLNIDSGQRFGLLGPNGSGKTTLLKLVSGLLKPNQGTIHINGKNRANYPTDSKKCMAFIPDTHLLYEGLNALENLNMYGILWGITKGEVIKTRSHILLERFGLWDVRNQLVKSYSRGMQQKLSICTALIHEPRIVLLDEPFLGIDMNAKILIKDILKEYSDRGLCIMFSSHNAEIIDSFSTHVAILNHGKITYNQPIHDVKKQGGIEKVFSDSVVSAS